MNSILDSVKHFIADFRVRRLNKLQKKNPVSFNNFINSSVEFFIILPEGQSKDEAVNDLFSFLLSHGKRVSVFTTIEDFNYFPFRMKTQLIDYTLGEITKFNLPDKNLAQRLHKRKFDVAIDLNLSENVFYSTIMNLIKAKFLIGFNKENSDTYYNVQIHGNLNNPKLAYENLVKSIRMF